MNKKKISVFICMIIALTIIISSCKKNNPGGETTVPELTQSTVPQTLAEALPLEVLTDENGNALTQQVTDEDGSTKILEVRIPATTASSTSANSGETTSLNPASTSAATTAPQVTYLVPVTEADGNITVIKNIAAAINSGNYRLKASQLNTDGEKLVMDLVIFGGKSKIKTDFDGVAIEMYIDGDKITMSSAEKKIYAKVPSFLFAMGGISTEDLNIAKFAEQGLVKDIDFSSAPAISAQTFDSKPAVRYTYPKSSGSTINFYFSDNQLAGIETADSDNVIKSSMDITLLDGNVSAADVSIPSDYADKNFLSFFSELGVSPE